MGNVIRKYKARGGKAGKGTIFKKKGKPYAEMTREEQYKWMRLGIEPKVSPTDTKKITKAIKKKTTNGKKLVDERFIAAVEKRPPPVKDTRFTALSDKVSPKKDVTSTDKKIGVVTKKKDYISPKLKDRRKYSPYKTTKKFVPGQEVKEKKKVEEEKKVVEEKKVEKKVVEKKVEEKLPVILKELKEREEREKKLVKTSNVEKEDTDVRIPQPNDVSSDPKDYSKEVLGGIAAIIIAGATANKFSKRIQRIANAIKRSPGKFTALIKRATNVFKANPKAIKKLDLRRKDYRGAKKKLKKKIPKRTLGGPKPKPEIIKNPQMLVSKGGGQIVSRKGSGAIGVGKALRGWGAVRKR